MKAYYKVNNIFASIQGEGSRKGIASWFIRLAECNLRNSCWEYGGCDTEFDYFYVTETQCILDEISKMPGIKDVVITGGEPTLQFLNPLITSLKNENKMVTLETNGILYPASAIDLIDIYSCSPKFTNFRTKFNPRVISSIKDTIYKEKFVQIKFVISSKDDIDFVENFLTQLDEFIIDNERVHVYFQPHVTNSSYNKESLVSYKSLLVNSLNNRILNAFDVHWNLQDHKILDME